MKPVVTMTTSTSYNKKDYGESEAPP